MSLWCHYSYKMLLRIFIWHSELTYMLLIYHIFLISIDLFKFEAPQRKCWKTIVPKLSSPKSWPQCGTNSPPFWVGFQWGLGQPLMLFGEFRLCLGCSPWLLMWRWTLFGLTKGFVRLSFWSALVGINGDGEKWVFVFGFKREEEMLVRR